MTFHQKSHAGQDLIPQESALRSKVGNGPQVHAQSIVWLFIRKVILYSYRLLHYPDKAFGDVGTCREQAMRSSMLSAATSEPSASVFRRIMEWGVY